MSDFRVGLIGCGGMGANLARQCNTVEGSRVTAVYDVSEEAAGKLAEEFQAKPFPSATDLMDADIDGVIIATPNDSHAPLTIQAARAGKHIFCEKPMAMSVADCDAMIAEAERAQVKLVVGQVLRLFPSFWRTKQIVASGEIGTPFGMSVRRTCGPDAFTGWRTTKKQAGGVLYELHVHELDLMRHIMGDAKTVYAGMGHFTSSPVEYEDVAFIQLGYTSGGIGALHCGLSSSMPDYTVMVQCEEGSLAIEGFGGPIRYCRFGDEPTEIDVATVEKEDPYREEVRSWVEWITSGTQPVFDARDGRAAIELAEAAYRSAHTGDVIKLPLQP